MKEFYEFINTPWFIIVTTLFLAFLIIFIILKLTTVGKKGYKKLVEDVNKQKEEILKATKTIKEGLSSFEKNNDEYKKLIEKKVKGLYFQYESFKKDVINTFSLIPNEKVKSQIEVIKNNAIKNEEYIKTLLGETYDVIVHDANADVRLEIDSLKDQIAQFEEELRKYEEMPVDGESDTPKKNIRIKIKK